MRLRPAVFYGPHSNDSVTLGGQTGRHGDGFNRTGRARARRRTRPHLGDAEGASAEPARFQCTQRAPLATLIEQYDQIHQEKLYLRNNHGCEARAAYDHVIVDEYQDLNRAEQDLIQLLSGNRAIALVGDVDQSIYHFRHANPDGIRTYDARYPGTHDEVLNECRRCPTRVVAIANHLISHNHPGLLEPRLQPRPGNAAGEIHLIQWGSVEEEAAGLAQYVCTLVERGVSPGDILILQWWII
jgi:superfamily I DNA/RNA helicase